MMDDDEFSEVVCEAFCKTSSTVEYVMGLFCEFCFVDSVFVFNTLECGIPKVLGIVKCVPLVSQLLCRAWTLLMCSLICPCVILMFLPFLVLCAMCLNSIIV